MAYMIKWTATVSYVGNGIGALTAAPGSPSVKINEGSALAGGVLLVPGGDTPTGANFTTSATSVGTNLGAALNQAALLAQMQGWATGTTQ